MRATQQTPTQNIVQHGLSVFQYTSKILNGNSTEICLPQWWDKYKEDIFSNLHDYKTIKHYTIWHDCGKPHCLEIDDEGKRHYPNHAAKSAEIWNQNFPDRPTIGRLIANDMAFHTLSADDILKEKLSDKDIFTLMIASLAELHSNAHAFYPDEGISSTWFKIKFKKWSKNALKICERIFDHSYMYVIVRKDLSVPQQAVQSAHAAIEAARHYIKSGDEHPSVIICWAKNEAQLMKIADQLREQKIDYQLFREPDRDNEATALASQPVKGKDRKAFAKFQLIK